MSARFDLKFTRRVLNEKSRHHGKLHCNFDSPEKLLLLSSLKEFKPSRNRKIITFLTFDNLFPPLLHSP